MSEGTPIPTIALAPMAGVTNSAYRQLCREQAELGTPIRPAGLFTCEMVTAEGLAMRIPKTLDMLKPDPGDPIRSVQLYALEPVTLSRAVSVCGDLGVTHIDLNFGCPVPKVTRKGGGGVLPWKLDRFAALLEAAVTAAAPFGLPVTIKTRLGIDAEHETFLDAGRIAQESGIAAVTLHARTVAQAYGGTADWSRITELVDALDIPVYGNGDIWEAADARRMMAETGCAGVVIGRGCLGRPWLFRDLAAGAPTASAKPTLGEVIAMVRRHAELLTEHFGSEQHGLADLRKFMSWYFKGFPLGGDLRLALGLVTSIADIDRLTADLDPATPYPDDAQASPRGRQGNPRATVKMPDNWLATRTWAR
ncbi:MAG: tRNA dihydrouridine synthase DusB [Propionibacteriaceae bacterium]|jgi:nifR3 family TIM-barrel protein|nr:tRNA dihydrouridine synthase DusB [Propionibacteriaceae bacterium]